MERRRPRKLANQKRHGAGLRAPSSDPGIPKAGSALPARGGRAPPGPAPSLSNSCGAPAGPEPEGPGRRAGRHRLRRPFRDCTTRLKAPGKFCGLRIRFIQGAIGRARCALPRIFPLWSCLTAILHRVPRILAF